MIKIHKEVYGQGKPIVLIHGWAMHTGVWRTFAQQLALHYEVTCLDLPGHGLSETVNPYTLDQISAALIGVLPETPFCLLGWSLGATVALAMTKQYPQQIKSLIILAGNPHFVQDESWAGMNPQILEDFSDNLELNGQLALIRFLSLQVGNLPNGKQILKEIKQVIQECDLPVESVLQSGLSLLKNSDLRAELMTIQCPVNNILGDKDILIPVQVGQNIKKIQPNCEINIIADAGHVPFLSHPSEVIDIINRFI
ncbi:MAG: pimeloyl-ACP methyl ester esterase BioH [Methylococcaceae bacterium]|nr:pimeloyl-ACP methyl ester esterase BioH [Methylococcaceae bacterium]